MINQYRRPACARCARPTVSCICALITPINNCVELLILQHPLEVNNAKNTLNLLRLSLQNNQVEIGESFCPDELSHWLFADDKVPLLLYPAAEENKFSPPPAALELACNRSPRDLRLVVLDGTWRKSRKMLYLNPLLTVLPRLSLTKLPASIYTIRKAHSENQLSTLEASCYALQQLEQAQVDYQPLLNAFSLFIEQLSNFIPIRENHCL